MISQSWNKKQNSFFFFFYEKYILKLTKFLNWRIFSDWMHGQVGVHDIKKKSLMRKMAPVAHLSSSSLPESVPVHEQQFEVECEFTFDHSRPPPPPSLKLSSKPESKVGWTAYYMSAAWRSDGAEWMNKWTPLLDVALAFHIALFAYLPLLRSVFLLLWSTIGTIVSIGVICCFWGGGALQWHRRHPLKYVHPSSRESHTGPQLS